MIGRGRRRWESLAGSKMAGSQSIRPNGAGPRTVYGLSPKRMQAISTTPTARTPTPVPGADPRSRCRRRSWSSCCARKLLKVRTAASRYGMKQGVITFGSACSADSPPRCGLMRAIGQAALQNCRQRHGAVWRGALLPHRTEAGSSPHGQRYVAERGHRGVLVDIVHLALTWGAE